MLVYVQVLKVNHEELCEIFMCNLGTQVVNPMRASYGVENATYAVRFPRWLVAASAAFVAEREGYCFCATLHPIATYGQSHHPSTIWSICTHMDCLQYDFPSRKMTIRGHCAGRATGSDNNALRAGQDHAGQNVRGAQRAQCQHCQRHPVSPLDLIAWLPIFAWVLMLFTQLSAA